MPYTCTVAGCSKRADRGVRSLHEFPDSLNVRLTWSRFVRRTYSGWAGPSSSSRICSDHFHPGCFENRVKWEMGLANKLELKPGSYPTIYPEGTCPSLASPSTTAKNIVDPVPVFSPPTQTVKTTGTSGTATTGPPCGPNIGATPSGICKTASPTFLTPKRPRSAFRKREVFRIMESSSENEERVVCHQLIDDHCPAYPNLSLKDASTQYEEQPGANRSVGIQTSLRFTKPPRRSKSTQVARKVASVGVSCNILKIPPDWTLDDEDFEMDDENEDCEEDNTSLYDPNDETDPGDEQEMIITSNASQSDECNNTIEEKFIVFKTCLWQLFETCPACTRITEVQESFRKGTCVTLIQKCICGYSRQWSSQPAYSTSAHTSIPEGNLQLSAAIFFNGTSAAKVIRVLKTMNIACITPSTFYNHAAKYLRPTVCHIWKVEQEMLLQRLASMEGGLVLGTDGRADSPGHSAKYGTYTVIEERINKVVDVQLVQSNEVANSNAMEKEGLIRAVRFIESKHLVIAVIITDGHVQIAKWIRENLPDVKHFLDAWHVAKGFTKKATALAQQKDCGIIASWVKSMTYHLYWAASSTPDGNGEMMVAKWTSMTNHVQNKHHGHSALFPDCEHDDDDDSQRKKKWLKPGSKAAEKLTELIENKRLLKSIKKLSPIHQTSNVEAFHSLILHFCPKHFAFSYKGMLCRLELAALHFNENSERSAAMDSSGQPAMSVRFPKAKKGNYSVNVKKTPATYGYVNNLMKVLTEEVVVNPDRFSDELAKISEPLPLSAQYEKPTTEEARAKFSRFEKK